MPRSWEMIQQLVRFPRRLIWDNESGIGQKCRLAQGVATFAGIVAEDARFAYVYMHMSHLHTD
jgi:hypothetical protein